MKFDTQTKTLREALSRLSVIPGAKQVGPAANLVKIKSGMSGLEITRSTPESYLTISVEGEIEEDGEFVCDYAKLSAILGRLSDREFNVESDEKWMQMKAGAISAKLAVIPSDGFISDHGNQEFKDTLKITVEEWSKCLAVVAAAMCADQLRPDLQSVSIRSIKDKLTFCGADGRRAHFAFTKLKSAFCAILPSSAVEAAQNAIKGSEGGIVAKLAETFILLQTSDLTMRLPLSVDKYPNVEPFVTQVEKVKPGCSIEVGREAFMESVKTVQLAGRGELLAVKLETSKNRIFLKGDNEGDSKIEEILEGKVSGTMAIEFNSKYLLPAIEQAAGENITLEHFILTNTEALYIRQDDRLMVVALIFKK